MKYLFEKVIIYNGHYVHCIGFKGLNSLVSKQDVWNCIENKKFTFDDNNVLNNVIKYLENVYIIQNKLYELIIQKKYDDYIDLKLDQMYKILIKQKVSPKALNHFYKQTIDSLKRNVLNGKINKIHSNIRKAEGNYISQTVEKNKFTKCLEVGMAFGISAFYILSNQDANLTSIDPNQSTQWASNGINLLREFGYEKRHHLIEAKSYVALPEILQKNGPKSFDFMFIDGFHTFDYTLLDFFYSDLLLKVGGIIVIDDALHRGVAKCVSYISTNYKFYKKLDSPPTVASFLKLGDDKREWNFHENF